MAHVAPTGSSCAESTFGFAMDLLVFTLVGARPTLATDGVSIAPWTVSGSAPNVAVLFLDGTLPCTVGVPVGGFNGVELYGYAAARAKWCWIPFIHNGADVPIFSALQSFCQEVDKLGVYSRLAVAGIPTAGIVTATFIPLARS